MDVQKLKALTARIEEIKKLYNIGEAEMMCLTQMSLMIKMLGYSPQLRVKLLKCLCAIDEMLVEEFKGKDIEDLMGD